MSKNSFKEYVENVRELNSLLEEFYEFNYKGSFCENIIYDIKKDIHMFKNVKAGIDVLKKDYATKTGKNIQDIIFRDMEDYYLLYCRNSQDSIYCYTLDERFLWKSNVNDRLVYENHDIFMVAVANEELDENKISGCTCCLMACEYGEIIHVPGFQIEDVTNFKNINENLICFNLNNENEINIYDKDLNRFIIKNVDDIKRLEEDCGDFKKEKCFVVTKRFSFEDRDVVCSFYIDNNGYIISDIIDSNGQYYVIENKGDKDKYVETLESKFDSIRANYEEKGYPYVKKLI